MKVKYLGTLFAASVLSLSLVACATPDAGNVDGAGESTEVDPDAGAADPGAGAADPGAGAADPGAGN